MIPVQSKCARCGFALTIHNCSQRSGSYCSGCLDGARRTPEVAAPAQPAVSGMTAASTPVPGPALMAGREPPPLYGPVLTTEGQPAPRSSPPPTGDSPPDPAGIPWTDEQRAVIEAGATCRLLVDAGPGTGKTAVACARVAHLLATRQVSPTNVHIISFTRTAVAEIRSRIARALDERIARQIRISTVDSGVWSLVHGFTEAESSDLLDGYERNIREATRMFVERRPALLDFVGRLEHLVVDEAQDLTGSRAALVLALIDSLESDCGVTVLGDAAQGIYGFTSEDTDESGEHVVTLMDQLAADQARSFQPVPLRQVHRTTNSGLREIFTKTRVTLLDPDSGADQLLAHIKADVLRHGSRCVHGDLSQAGPCSLALFRRRIEVLYQSSVLSAAGIAHKLRLPQLPSAVEPWIGSTFWRCDERIISREQFMTLFSRAAAERPRHFDAIDAPSAWRQLLNHADDGDGKLDLLTLRQLLARTRPPVELCSADLGTGGPILGTIHASKGREAPTVVLEVVDGGPPPSARSNPREEARVVFVGATRARSNLVVLRRTGGWVAFSRPTGSGRVTRGVKGGVMAEIGLDGDVDASAHVRMDFADAGAAIQIQQRLASLHAEQRHVPCRAWSDSSRGWRYRLQVGEEPCFIGEFSRQFGDDIWKILRSAGGRRSPDRISHLYFIGARTVALGPDDPRLEALHPPFSRSGMFLAPIVKGYTKLPLLRGRADS